jgi:hypothetical protein
MCSGEEGQEGAGKTVYSKDDVQQQMGQNGKTMTFENLDGG